MLFKLIFASRSYSRHDSFYRHVQLFWLVTERKICALFQICVIIECPHNFLDFVDVSHLCDTWLGPGTRNTWGREGEVDLIDTRIDLSAFLTWSETNSTCHAWIRNRNVPARLVLHGLFQGSVGRTKREKKASNKTREAREEDDGNEHKAWAGKKSDRERLGTRWETFHQFRSRSQRCWVRNLN